MPGPVVSTGVSCGAGTTGFFIVNLLPGLNQAANHNRLNLRQRPGAKDPTSLVNSIEFTNAIVLSYVKPSIEEKS